MTDTRSSRLPARLWNMGPRERAITIVFAVIALIAILFVFLSKGGGDEIPEVTSTPSVRTSPTSTATSPPETGQSFEGKDPFQPLVIVQAIPSGSAGPTPTPTGSETGVNGGNTANPATTVTLIDIRKQDGELTATVQVDDQEYTVIEGETFAGNFRVISLNSSCGTFVFGDERFSLCVGQEVRK